MHHVGYTILIYYDAQATKRLKVLFSGVVIMFFAIKPCLTINMSDCIYQILLSFTTHGAVTSF
jgi:hypothetical protein